MKDSKNSNEQVMKKKKNKDYNIDRLLDSLPTTLLLINRQKRIIEANPEATKFLGENIESKTIDEVFNCSEEEIFDKVFEGGTIERREIELEDRIIGFSASPLYNNENEIEGASIILRDITEIKEMEEELRKKDRLAALGEMVAGMAHEIRNPLASIKVGIESLSFDEEKNEKASRYKSIILKEIERLERIVNDMTVYAGEKPLNKQKVNLQHLINQTLMMFHQEMNERNIEAKNIYQGELDCMVDRDQMITVLTNLLLNAIHSIGKDGLIEIRTKEKERDLMIEIKDNGVGIPEKVLSKIFIPFFTTKSEGTGLGLSIVNRIIRNHNGIIQASNWEKGACFFIAIPKGF